jgi:hypothetical protein
MLNSTNRDPDFMNTMASPVCTPGIHFLYYVNPMRVLNTTLLKCLLPSTDTIDRREKCMHEYKGSRSSHESSIN